LIKYKWYALCTTGIHNTTQNSSDSLPSYPPDNYHSSDTVHWMGGGRLRRGFQHCRYSWLPLLTRLPCSPSLTRNQTRSNVWTVLSLLRDLGQQLVVRDTWWRCYYCHGGADRSVWHAEDRLALPARIRWSADWELDLAWYTAASFDSFVTCPNIAFRPLTIWSDTDSINLQWLKCHRTQGNAVAPPPIYGGRRCPASDFRKDGRKRYTENTCHDSILSTFQTRGVAIIR